MSGLDDLRLREADLVLEQYAEKDSTIDCGNLFFAATEFKRAYSEANAGINKIAWVPGLFKCAKCGFVLQSNTLYMKSGTIGPNDKPQQCLNGCGSMWRVAWPEHVKNICAGQEAMVDQMVAQRELIKQLASALDGGLLAQDVALRVYNEWRKKYGG